MKTSYWKLQKSSDNKEALQQAAALIRAGEVVSFPTETVYGLGADGLNPEAVAKIFAAKGRPNDNPLILHIAKKEDIAQLTTGLNANAKKLIEHFWPGPLTLIVNKSSIVPDAVSAGLETVAVRFPSNKFAQDFIRACGCPIAAPSANISGRPSPTNAQDVLEDMQGKIAAVVDGGACSVGVESTVIALEPNGTVRILRPGFVTKEMLEEVVPEVTLDPAILHQLQEGQTVRSPGMKYQHYSPRAHVILVEGSWQNFAALAEQNRADGVYALVFDGEETMLSLPCLTYGRSGREQAQQIFSKLRELDDDGAQKVYVRAPKPEGIGLAVYNRLIRAAGFEVIQV